MFVVLISFQTWLIFVAVSLVCSLAWVLYDAADDRAEERVRQLRLKEQHRQYNNNELFEMRVALAEHRGVPLPTRSYDPHGGVFSELTAMLDAARASRHLKNLQEQRAQ